MILACVAHRQAKRNRAAKKFSLQQHARRQQGGHELVGAKLSPIHAAASARRFCQMLFIRRHQGECPLAGLAQHRWAIEQRVAEFMSQRRAFQIIPSGDELGIQADQQRPWQRRVGLRDPERVAAPGIMDTAVEIPMRGDLGTVDRNLFRRAHQPVDVDAEHRSARQKLAAHLVGDAQISRAFSGRGSMLRRS